MSLIKGRKTLNAHLELTAIIQLYLFICILTTITLVFYVKLLAAEVMVIDTTLTTHVFLGLALGFEDVEGQCDVLS